MKIRTLAGFAALVGLSLYSCKKSNDTPTISQPQFHAGQTITGDTLKGTVKGTMLAGKTYYFKDQVTVNAGDTLLMQSGVKLLSLAPAARTIVNGAFISLGTKAQPNWITGVDAYNNPDRYKLKTPQNPNTDPGLDPNGALWGGIQCCPTATLVDIKWTHVDFAGGTASTSNPPSGYTSGSDLFDIFFQNAQGDVILEDDWFYRSTTDVLRVDGGKVAIMRNTVEKMAYNDGDAFNVKNSSTGTMAYNLIIGSAKGGTKASNKGTYGSAQADIDMYNNTYICGGWRSVDPDRGANVDFEQGAKGRYYNNIMVDCKTGPRILENPVADTANCFYGNSLSYGDSEDVVDAFYPPTHISKPMPTDIPDPATFYPGYPNRDSLGEVYAAPQLVGKNNPEFVNYPLPVSAPFALMNFQGDFDFHLKTNSPAIGKGYVGFTPLDATSDVANSYLKADVTAPNKDLGAFPVDGTGNQHQ